MMMSQRRAKEARERDDVPLFTINREIEKGTRGNLRTREGISSRK